VRRQRTRRVNRGEHPGHLLVGRRVGRVELQGAIESFGEHTI
jgi:hypothetical protein